MRRSVRTFKPKVEGSNPSAGTTFCIQFRSPAPAAVPPAYSHDIARRWLHGLAIGSQIRTREQRFFAPLSSSSGGQPTGSRWARGRD